MTYAWINYLSALASDRVVFNSQFHLDEFFGALPDLLRRFPDYAHLGALAELRAKSSVLRLGLDLDGLDAARPAAEAQRSREPGPLVVLWNHRWEYDKNPQAFFRAVNRLDDAGERFRLILAGKTFEEQPPAFQAGFSRYAERVLHYGFAESFQDYAALLWRSDVVVSTSVHEFFGVSMLEAIHCGCHPLLPDRLTYPELVPERLHAPLLHAPRPLRHRGRPVRDAPVHPARPVPPAPRRRPARHPRRPRVAAPGPPLRRPVRGRGLGALAC